MKNTKLDVFVEIYNKFAEIHNIKQTDKKGIARRLVNAQCGFKAGDNIITERQMMALFVSSFKGNREVRNRQILLFGDIAEALLSDISYFGLAMAIKEVEDKELSTMAKQAKKAIAGMLTKAKAERAIMSYNAQNTMTEPTTDKECIQLAKEAIRKLSDKSMLIDLFNVKRAVEKQEAAS